MTDDASSAEATENSGEQPVEESANDGGDPGDEDAYEPYAVAAE